MEWNDPCSQHERNEGQHHVRAFAVCRRISADALVTLTLICVVLQHCQHLDVNLGTQTTPGGRLRDKTRPKLKNTFHWMFLTATTYETLWPDLARSEYVSTRVRLSSWLGSTGWFVCTEEKLLLIC